MSGCCPPRRSRLPWLLAAAAAVAAIAAVAAFSGCDATPLGDGPRRAALRRIATRVIVPTYQEVAGRAGALAEAAAALSAQPDAATLAAAQAAWRAARAPWLESEAFRLGPARDNLHEGAIDQNPADAAAIEGELAGSAELTADYVDGLGASRKGFHALELFLFDPAGDGAVLAALTDAGLGARRRAYLAAAAESLHRRCVTLAFDWTGGGDGDTPGYVERFVDVGGPDASFATIKEAIDALLNEEVFVAELVADGKLGKPLGVDGSGPHPERAESARSDNSLADIASNLRGLRAVYQGWRGDDASEWPDAGPDPGTSVALGNGLDGLVAAASPGTDFRLRRDLAAVETAVAGLGGSLAAALSDHPDMVTAAWSAARELRTTISVDVIGALGATLTFNGNDGD